MLRTKRWVRNAAVDQSARRRTEEYGPSGPFASYGDQHEPESGRHYRQVAIGQPPRVGEIKLRVSGNGHLGSPSAFAEQWIWHIIRL